MIMTHQITHKCLAEPHKDSAIAFLRPVDLSDGSWLLPSFPRPIIYFHLLVQAVVPTTLSHVRTVPAIAVAHIESRLFLMLMKV